MCFVFTVSVSTVDLFDDLTCKEGEEWGGGNPRLRPRFPSSRIRILSPILSKGVRTHVKSVGTVTTPNMAFM